MPGERCCIKQQGAMKYAMCALDTACLGANSQILYVCQTDSQGLATTQCPNGFKCGALLPGLQSALRRCEPM
jgi:hypothetical protein